MRIYVSLMVISLLLGFASCFKVSIPQDTPIFEDRLNLTIRIEAIYNGDAQVSNREANVMLCSNKIFSQD